MIDHKLSRKVKLTLNSLTKRISQNTLMVFVFLILPLFVYPQEPGEDLLNMAAITPNDYEVKDISVRHISTGLELTIKPGVKGSISCFPDNDYWDLTQWVFLSLELENLTEDEVRFDPVLAYDNPGRADNNMVNNTHIGYLQPSENRVFNCVLIRDQITAPDYPQKSDFPGMKGLPDGIILNYSGIDAKHIKELKIIFPEQEAERKVLFKRIYKNRPALPALYKSNKEEFFPFINKYGQYKHATWDGKITDDSQFAEALVKEAKDLQEHPGSDEWNRFGGNAKGPKFEATGHFRTMKLNGKWWIIDPDGNLFWSAGVNSAGKLLVSTPIDGREHFFEGIPVMDSENEALFNGANIYNYGLANQYRKYGKDSEENYVAVSLKRMKSWGLNTLGGWSVENVGQFPEDIRLPYTVFIGSDYPAINDKFPDVFDSRWITNIEESIKEKAAFVKDDPYFFGFFINNEIHWGNPLSLAVNTLSRDGNTVGKQVYVALLQERLETVNSFNSLTGAAVSSWEELLNTEMNTTGLDIYALKEINIEHYENMCEVYFKTTREYIDQYAPGKMYLGCRWHGNHKNIYNMTVAAKYLDIFSFNAYENEIEFYPYPPESIDVPFIISEFNFGALDRGKFFTGLGYASDQRNRGEKYVNFIRGALQNPKCVGAHWFMWANTTTAGRRGGENANCGLVSATDQIYYELISYMRKANYHLYSNISELTNAPIRSEFLEDTILFPNPSDSQLHIQTTANNLLGEIYSMTGKTVWSGSIENGIVNIEELNEGMYLLRITDGRDYKSFKIVKGS